MIPEGKLSMTVRLVAGQDLDGGMTPWHGVCGPMPISLEVQRTIKKKSDTLAFLWPCANVRTVRKFLG